MPVSWMDTRMQFNDLLVKLSFLFHTTLFQMDSISNSNMVKASCWVQTCCDRTPQTL